MLFEIATDHGNIVMVTDGKRLGVARRGRSDCFILKTGIGVGLIRAYLDLTQPEGTWESFKKMENFCIINAPQSETIEIVATAALTIGKGREHTGRQLERFARAIRFRTFSYCHSYADLMDDINTLR